MCLLHNFAIRVPTVHGTYPVIFVQTSLETLQEYIVQAVLGTYPVIFVQTSLETLQEHIVQAVLGTYPVMFVQFVRGACLLHNRSWKRYRNILCKPFLETLQEYMFMSHSFVFQRNNTTRTSLDGQTA